jgi:DNA modification methylase
MKRKEIKMKEKKSKVDLSADIPIHCSYSQLTAIQELNPNPRNYNKHPDEQIALLAKNIRALGWRHPIIVSKLSGKIVAGHARLEAAKLLSLQTVPVDFQSFNSQDEENAYLIADNKIAELAELDESQLKELLTELTASEIDMDLTGFTEQALSEILKQEDGEADAEPQIDNADELNKVWQVKVGDVWTIGNHRLMCGDSTNNNDVDKLMMGEKASMVFTDPPYNVDYGANENHPSHKIRTIVNDKMSDSDWNKFVVGYMKSIFRMTDGNIYISMSDKELGHMQSTFRDCGGKWASFIIWVKDSLVLSAKDYHSRHETILYGWKEGAKERLRVEDRKQDDVWEIDRPKKSEDHPTMKPVALVERAINNSSKQGWIIGDLFLGSGTTMVACENLHRKCYGMEITPNYCAVILQRMKDAFPSLEIKRVE